MHLTVSLNFLNSSRRGIRKPNVVIGGHKKAGSASGGVVNGLPDFRVNDLDHSADNMPGRAELTELTRLLDLLQHMLEQIAFCIRIRAVEP